MPLRSRAGKFDFDGETGGQAWSCEEKLMSLIEQLGGYERAKSELKDKKWRKDNLHGSVEFTWHVKQHIQLLESVLLEYRRQHNIFEVGDIAVNSRGDESRLLKIWRVDMCAHNSKMSIADYDAESLGGWSRFHALRHATDEEIKAGKRLSHN